MTARTLCALALATAAAQSALAQGTLEWQVSPALQETWTSSLDAFPGQSIDIRLRISYTGTATPVGLASIFYQPAISNWDSAGPAHDSLLPFLTTGGVDAPRGDVADSPGLYGRVFPFGWRAPSNGAYQSYLNTAGGINYLRIAQANTSSWVGGTGNTGGGRGVNAGQPPPDQINQHPTWPALNTGLTDLVVLKLGITLSQDANLRTLFVNSADAFAGRPFNAETQLKWFASLADTLPGSESGDPLNLPATIHIVPAPWTLVILGAALTPRRRRTQ